MARYGLLINYGYCTGCHTCEVACNMEHSFPVGQWGIRLAEIGPWQISGDKWQFSNIPVPTDQCDLCEELVAQGKEPACVQHCPGPGDAFWAGGGIGQRNGRQGAYGAVYAEVAALPACRRRGR